MPQGNFASPVLIKRTRNKLRHIRRNFARCLNDYERDTVEDIYHKSTVRDVTTMTETQAAWVDSLYSTVRYRSKKKIYFKTPEELAAGPHPLLQTSGPKRPWELNNK